MPLKRHLETIFSSIDEGFCLCEIVRDADGRACDYRFLEVNPLFEAMTGLKDARGRTALDLLPNLEAKWVETYARVAEGEALRFQNGSDEMGRWFDVFATPVPPDGCFALVFRDITAQRRAEAEREAARAQAEQLLAELNHRVMNSLAMIAAIVRMEGQLLDPDNPACAVIERLQTRLGAVTSLYRALNRAASSAEVPAADYLAAVARSVVELIAQPERVRLECDILPLMLPTDQAAPLGLLLNELMTNAVKYAFQPARSGTIRVTLAREGASLRLTVSDDGGGDTADADTAPAAGTGMGTRLIDGFTAQLGGTVERATGACGTTVAISFPSAPPASRSAG